MSRLIPQVRYAMDTATAECIGFYFELANGLWVGFWLTKEGKPMLVYGGFQFKSAEAVVKRMKDDWYKELALDQQAGQLITDWQRGYAARVAEEELGYAPYEK
jgi:hypothetical protein